MKISSLEEYGLRCIIQLGKGYELQLMTAEEISKKEGLSLAYTEKILQKLGKAGFVKSIRGVKGGYTLSSQPKEIMVGHVTKALDGNFFEDLCGHFSGKSDECNHISGCGIRPVWKSVYKYIYDVLDKTSIYDLMQDEAEIYSTLESKFLAHTV